MAILQTKNLTFRYPEEKENALSGVTLTVEPGEFVVVAGASGSGKTTLLRLLKREIAPYGKKTGDVLFDGIPQEKLEERDSVSGIGFVFQDPESQIVADRVMHELAFGMESLGISNAEMGRRIAEITGYFGIGDLVQREVHDLSGGEKQMLNLASVLVMRPKLLLLDEPTAQLDPIAAANFLSTLQKLNRETGITVILTEHRLEEALPIADRFVLMDRGQAVFDGCPENAAQFFETAPDHPMRNGLPTAMRLFGNDAAKENLPCPLSVRDGRTFLRERYGNEVRTLPEATGEEAEKTSEKASGKEEETPAVELDRVWFRYEKDSRDVLREASLKIRKGEHFAILGGNGEGKSTALRIISGLAKPYRGSARLFGRKTTEFKGTELYGKILAMLPQDPKTVFLKKTLIDDLTDVLLKNGENKEKVEEKVRSVAEELGLAALFDRHPYDLSGGEQEKAALAKALLKDPEILLLDEPTKGLDAAFKKELSEMIRKLTSNGVTVVTVTHDVEFAAVSADRLTFLFDGGFREGAAPETFFSENVFYTTAASRISRGYYDRAVTVESVAKLMELNERKRAE